MRQHILDIMCRHETHWCETAGKQPYFQGIVERLAPMVEDGLVEIGGCGMRVTENGRHFVRNICMAFDLRLAAKQPERVIFSATV